MTSNSNYSQKKSVTGRRLLSGWCYSNNRSIQRTSLLRKRKKESIFWLVSTLKDPRTTTSSQQKVHNDSLKNWYNKIQSHPVRLNNREVFQRTLAGFMNWSRNSALVNIWPNMLPLYHHSISQYIPLLVHRIWTVCTL